MQQYFFRKDNQFVINSKLLSERANTPTVINALYAAVYLEFRGAVDNPKYKDLNTLEKMQKLNEFAHNWLKTRGLL